MPRNFLWSERLRSSDQTTWAVQAMNRPLALSTKGISALEFNCLDRRMNAPLRLRFSVVPSTMPVGALIETGHFTLALVWRRLSVPITACEIMCRRFFVVLLQKVLNWIQITGIRGTDATKKTPIDPMPMGATYESGMNTIETDRLLRKKGVLRCLLLCLLKEYHPIVPQILWKAHYMLSPLALSLF